VIKHPLVLDIKLTLNKYSKFGGIDPDHFMASKYSVSYKWLLTCLKGGSKQLLAEFDIDSKQVIL
jgi:hypothetical protein